MKIIPQQKPITMVKFPKDFDLDDIHISQDTEDAVGQDFQFGSVLQNMLDDLIDKNNKNNNIILDNDDE